MKNNNSNQKTPTHNNNQKMKALPPKRIIVFDFHSKMMIGVIKALQNRSIEIIYWTAGKRDFINEVFENKDLFPNIIFYY